LLQAGAALLLLVGALCGCAFLGREMTIVHLSVNSGLPHLITRGIGSSDSHLGALVADDSLMMGRDQVPAAFPPTPLAPVPEAHRLRTPHG
jgi:hypothetical protein